MKSLCCLIIALASTAWAGGGGTGCHDPVITQLNCQNSDKSIIVGIAYYDRKLTYGYFTHQGFNVFYAGETNARQIAFPGGKAFQITSSKNPGLNVKLSIKSLEQENLAAGFVKGLEGGSPVQATLSCRWAVNPNCE